MATDVQLYPDINREAFQRLRVGLERARAPLPLGDAGTISSNGLVGSFAYSEADQTLELSIEKYPMLIPKKMIWSAIEGAIIDAKRS